MSAPTEPCADAQSPTPPRGLPARSDPGVAEVVRAWRRLTTPARSRRAGPGAPTLVACSGGCDSSALVLALAAAGAPIVVAHVVHDLRAPELAQGDRDAARALATGVGAAFVEARVQVRAEGEHSRGRNLEAVARRERYRALAQLAQGCGLHFVATAHHADDQLETVLMALLRGAGPDGLAGIASTRSLAGSRVRLVRPALGVARADLERICVAAGWVWREDHTNADVTRLRAALRVRVLPELRRLRPGVAARAVDAAWLMGDVAQALDQAGARLIEASATARGAAGEPLTLDRGRLAKARAAVLGAALRRGLAAIVGADTSRDRRPLRGLRAIMHAIRDEELEPRTFELRGAVVEITATSVRLCPPRGHASAR